LEFGIQGLLDLHSNHAVWHQLSMTLTFENLVLVD